MIALIIIPFKFNKKHLPKTGKNTLFKYVFCFAFVRGLFGKACEKPTNYRTSTEQNPNK